MRSNTPESPFNALPPAVVALTLPIFLVEVALALGARGLLGGAQAIGWRSELVRRLGIFPELFDWMLETGRWPAHELARTLVYPFVHANFTHMLMALVFILALGKMVGEVLGSRNVIVVFFGAAVGGAVAYAVLATSPAPLIGAYPGAYGLIGAFTFILWVRLGQTGDPQIRAFSLIFFLMGIQLFFALLFGTSQDWIADLAGFACGFALCFLLVPGGWSYLLTRIRRR